MLLTDGACMRERIGRLVIMGGTLNVPGNAGPPLNVLAFPFSRLGDTH